MRIFLWIVAALAVCVLTAALALRVQSARDLRRVETDWHALLPTPGARGTFDPAMVEGLPDPARRYLLHALAPGTPLSTAVELTLHGQYWLGSEVGWRAFAGGHLVVPGAGYVWRAEMSGEELTFAEVYREGHVRSRFWWQKFLPTTRSGPDADRAARGRVGFDRVFLPASLLPQSGVTWEAVDADRAAVGFEVDGEPVTLVLRVDESGALRDVRTRRWGDSTDDRAFSLLPFGAEIRAERTFDGVTLPSELSLRWWPESARELEFLRVHVAQARFHGSS